MKLGEMTGNKNEPRLTYALDAFGKMVCIDSVERGLSCNCRCPKCNEPLVAKLGHEGGRQAHFAHGKYSDCHGSYMTALHKLAEQIIEEEKAVMAPEYNEIAWQRLSFIQVEVEQRVERKDLQPDVVGITEDGLRWFIEIRNTHEVDEAKKAKLIESNITCLEIDVSKQTLENLKSFILESTENRKWINNPNYDAQIVESKLKRVSKVEKYLLRCTELPIPAYEDYDSKKISIKEVYVLSKTDDKLFSQVKVLSSDGTSFVFNIGSLRGLTNAGRRTKYQIAQKFSAYVNAGGKKLNGLVKRRKAEHDLFVKPIVNSTNKYEVGREYKVKVSGLRTRTDATVNAPIAYPKNLRKGSKIKCLEVKRDTSGNTWIRSEKGWSAALYEGKVYVG